MVAIALTGSEREPLPGASTLGPADPAERVQVSVIVRHRAVHEMRQRLAALVSGDYSHAPMSRQEFARRHGADPADLAAVRQFAAAHGLTVVEEHAARRTVRLSGAVSEVERAFGVQLMRMMQSGAVFRGRVGVISLPEELRDSVIAVLGLDDRPQAKPHFRFRDASSTSTVSYTPIQVADAYGFPDNDGTGECVALIELGGGYVAADLAAYFARLGVDSPAVVAVPVDGASNAPTGAGNGPDGEVMLDIEVVGAIAPRAKIAVYFAPNTDAGFLDAITTAIHDSTNKPSVISISWGGPESSWTAQAKTAMDQALQAAAALGLTVCVASGDGGSSDGAARGAHVDFPASSPFALACGGTTLNATATGVVSEIVWNDGAQGGASGGGISTFFALPTWQSGLSAETSSGRREKLSKRGVPDVAGNADPETGYQVRVDGNDTVIGGTSAVAPLWAALIARINAAAGVSSGLINPSLYARGSAFRDITQGTNGAFDAAAGWDACTGLGSPMGGAIAAVLVNVKRSPSADPPPARP